jgi:hypothetical protein
LLDWGFALFNQRDEDGYLTQEVEVSMPTQPQWALNGSQGGPADWVQRWN